MANAAALAIIRVSTAVAYRSYSVLYRDSASTGAWLKLVDVAAQPATQTTVVTDSSSLAQGQRFYRIVTPAAP
jgi:hypothetical protein